MSKSCIWVYDDLKRSGILDKVKRVYRSDNYLSICLVVDEGRFFSELIFIQRTCHCRYYVSYKDKRYKAERYPEVLPIVERIVDEILERVNITKEQWLENYLQRMQKVKQIKS